VVAEDDAWVEGQSLISTVEDVELIDPDLSGERLLYRLFHERGVRVFPPLPLRAQCSCSRDAVCGDAHAASFAQKDRAEMVKDGKVVVTCEFCSSVYEIHAGGSGRGVAASSMVARSPSRSPRRSATPISISPR
jgi:molecular chaperone Hsp33